MIHKNIENQRRMKKQCNSKGQEYNPFCAWYNEDLGRYTRDDKYRMRIKRFLKKASNKKIRNYKGELSEGCNHRKLFDYWWELF